jgi:hypothetical protein
MKLGMALALSFPASLAAPAENKSAGYATISVQVNGAGSVKPNYNGRRLKVGSWIFPKLKPAKGYVWAGWTGNAQLGEQPCYECNTFTVQPGLQLQANFVPNPFPAVQGNYAGLIWTTNGTAPAGSFALKLTDAGGLTGNLVLDGRNCPIGGSGYHEPVRADGRIELRFYRGNPYDHTLRQVMIAELQFDLTKGTFQVNGTLSDAREVKVNGTWTELPSEWTNAMAGDRIPPTR